MIRWPLRLTVFPVVIVLQILEWAGTFIAHYLGTLCRLITGVIFTLVVIGFITGLGIEEQLTKMLAVGVGFFFIPRICGTIVGGVVRTRTVLRNLIR